MVTCLVVIVIITVAALWYWIGRRDGERDTERRWSEAVQRGDDQWRRRLDEAEHRVSHAETNWGNWEKFGRSLADHLWRLWGERDEAEALAAKGLKVVEHQNKWNQFYREMLDRIDVVMADVDQGPQG